LSDLGVKKSITAATEFIISLVTKINLISSNACGQYFQRNFANEPCILNEMDITLPPAPTAPSFETIL